MSIERSPSEESMFASSAQASTVLDRMDIFLADVPEYGNEKIVFDSRGGFEMRRYETGIPVYKDEGYLTLAAIHFFNGRSNSRQSAFYAVEKSTDSERLYLKKHFLDVAAEEVNRGDYESPTDYVARRRRWEEDRKKRHMLYLTDRRSGLDRMDRGQATILIDWLTLKIANL